MHILIISDAYPPMRTSCAIQIYDLAQAFLEQGHQVSVIIPAHSQKNVVEISNLDGPTVFSVRCFKTKDVSYLRRTLAEFINPFLIGFHLKRNTNFIGQKIDGITWYSPTIFWGPLVKQLKEQFKCKAYLILRDIFPDWAFDLGIIRSQIIFRLFKYVANYQFTVANLIGAQSPKNIPYLKMYYPVTLDKLEILWNWKAVSRRRKYLIDLEKTLLSGKFIFVYAGNLGSAQGIEVLIDLATSFKVHNDTGFLFIGRGSEKQRLERKSIERGLKNILFLDEIEPEALMGLLEQCQVGLIALNPNHKTHNIPGKFLAYMDAGLPVLGLINPNNDLIEIIDKNSVGLTSSTFDNYIFYGNALKMIEIVKSDHNIKDRCKNILTENFSALRASKQICNYFNN